MTSPHRSPWQILCAVALIVGIEAVVAVPKITEAIKDYRLDSAAMELGQDLRKAQFMAIKERQTIRVVFDYNSYKVIRASIGEVILSRYLSIDYPELGLVMTESRGDILFERTGSVEGGSKEIEIIGPTGKRTITILATGRISGPS